MDMRSLLMELLMGQAQGGPGGMAAPMAPKMTDRMWAGGPTMDMGPGGAPLMPNSSPMMSRGGMVPGASEMPKTTPSMGPLGFNQGPGQSVPMTPPAPSFGPGNMPPGFGLVGGGMPPEAPPSGPGAPGMLGFMPPTGQPMGLGQGQPPAATPMPAPGGPGPSQFRAQAGGLFGFGGKSLYDIFADTMAGAANADPTAPGIKAFAQGATGARASRKLRSDEATATQDKAYEREGTELDREVKRGEFENTKKMAPLMRAKTAAEVKDTLDYSKRQKQIDAAALDAISRDTLLTPEEKIAKIKEYLGEAAPQGQDGGGGKPADGTRGKWKGKVITYNAAQDAWFDEQGNPVDLPTQ